MTHQHLIPLCTASRACFASHQHSWRSLLLLLFTLLCVCLIWGTGNTHLLPHVCNCRAHTCTNTSRAMAGARLAGCLCVLPHSSHGYPNLREWQSLEREAKASVLQCCGAPVFTREEEELHDILWTKSSRMLISPTLKGNTYHQSTLPDILDKI